MNQELLRFTDVREAVKLSRTTIWRLEREGKFPARRQLGANSVAWVRKEIDEFIQSRPIVGCYTANRAKQSSPGRPRGSQTTEKPPMPDAGNITH